MKQVIITPHHRISSSTGSIFFLSTAIFIAYISYPVSVSASDEFWEALLEVGGSVGYVTVSQRPEWSAINFRTGSVAGALRIVRGLSIQGGYEGSLVDDISLKSLDYGSDLQLKKINGSYYGSPWLGVRYEISSDFLKGYQFKSYSFYGSLGYTWARFGVMTNEWIFKGVSDIDNSDTKYHIAETSGPYGIIALRWRLDSDLTGNNESLFGTYGFDFGLKYIRLSSCSPRYDTIVKSGSGFSFLQVFITGFIKLSIFE